MNDSAFSLDFNEKYTRMCDLSVTDDKIELLSLGFDETIPNFFTAGSDVTMEQQAQRLVMLHENLQIKKKKVQIVIPDNFTYSQIIEMPKLSEKELIKAIRYQADEFIPLPIDDVYIDIEILSEHEQEKKILVLIVASPKKIVDRIYHTIELAKLVPESLENELSATGRFISDILHIDDEPVLIINFGYSSSSLYVVDPTSSLIVLSRSIKIGLDLLVRDLKINLNWDDAKAFEALKTIGLNTNGSVDLNAVVNPIMKELLQEVEKTIMQARDKMNIAVKQIFTCNYDRNIAHFPEAIQGYLNIPTKIFPYSQLLLPNPITQSFTADMSSFVSVIAGYLR